MKAEICAEYCWIFSMLGALADGGNWTTSTPFSNSFQRPVVSVFVAHAEFYVSKYGHVFFEFLLKAILLQYLECMQSST